MRTHQGCRASAGAALLVAVAGLALGACGGSKVPDLPTPTVAGTIAFESGPGGETWSDISVVRTDGTGLRRVVHGDRFAFASAWSPDATKIACIVQTRGGKYCTVKVVNADGSNATDLPSGQPMGSLGPAWSPDGRRIVVSSSWNPSSQKPPAHIFVMNADGSGRRQLTSGSAFDLEPAWAPDGQRILFARWHSWDKPVGDVYWVRPDGSGLAKVANMGEVSGFALSPDGSQLAVGDHKAHRIVVLPFGSSGSSGPSRTLIDTDYGWNFVGLSWSPDGKALVVGCNGYPAPPDKLVVVNADGSDLSAIPNVKGFNPAWRPQ
jgi:Tol biopolymer transport system component